MRPPAWDRASSTIRSTEPEGVAAGRLLQRPASRLIPPSPATPEGHMTPAAQVAAAIEILESLPTIAAGRRHPEEWACRTASRLQGSRRDLQPRLRRAEKARLIRLYYGRRQRPRRDDRRAARGARPERDTISALFSGEGHAPAPLTLQERERLEKATLDALRPMCAAITRMAGATAGGGPGRGGAARGRGAGRARSIDLRVNILKASREQRWKNSRISTRSRRRSRRSACAYSPAPTDAARRWRRDGLREGPRRDAGRGFAARGAALRRAAGRPDSRPMRWRGGKTLALAAQTIIAARSTPMTRTGAGSCRSMSVWSARARATFRFAPRGKADVLTDLENRCDIVLIDAPARHRHMAPPPGRQMAPRSGALDLRQKDQRELLERAARYVKPKAHRLCDLLAAARRNEDRIGEFLSGHKEFLAIRAGNRGKGGATAACALRLAHGVGCAFRRSPRAPTDFSSPRCKRAILRQRPPSLKAGFKEPRQTRRPSGTP